MVFSCTGAEKCVVFWLSGMCASPSSPKFCYGKLTECKYSSVEACPSKLTDGAKINYFPGEDTQCETETEFVRGGGVCKNWLLKPASRIYSLHFSGDCYVQSPKLMKELQCKRNVND